MADQPDDPPIPLVGISGTNPPAPDQEVTFLLMSVPESRSAEELAELGPSGLIQATAELRKQFGLSLNDAVEATRNCPYSLGIGLESELEPKAEAMRQWGCVVALVRPA